jgi:hypothetical protein
MLQRYHIQLVAFKATHDIFTELQKLQGKDEVKFLFKKNQ